MNVRPVSNLLDLSSKNAIVTGGGVGIGQAICYRLAEAGAHVLIADSSESNIKAAKQVFEQTKFSVDYVLTDVSSEADVRDMVAHIVDSSGSIDILVNNAGIYPNISLLDMTPQDFSRVIDVNLKGVFLTTHAAAKQMIAQGGGGKIINITSVDALHPSSIGLAQYDASKHGVWGFTKNVALELAQHNIWVNAVAPGGVSTPGTQMSSTAQPTDATAVDMSAVLKNFLSKIPMHRMGEPDEIGKVVLFLASEMSSYMTGSQIVVDGGVLLS